MELNVATTDDEMAFHYNVREHKYSEALALLEASDAIDIHALYPVGSSEGPLYQPLIVSFSQAPLNLYPVNVSDVQGCIDLLEALRARGFQLFVSPYESPLPGGQRQRKALAAASLKFLGAIGGDCLDREHFSAVHNDVVRLLHDLGLTQALYLDLKKASGRLKTPQKDSWYAEPLAEFARQEAAGEVVHQISSAPRKLPKPGL